MKPLDVVCALILNAEGKILACQRNSNTSLAHKWEFPGGKIEPDESPEQALEREVSEELGVRISILKALTVVKHKYPGFEIILSPFLCEIDLLEIPRAIEHSEIRWVNLAEASDLDWAEADIPILKQYEKSLLRL
jgi:8-oxo-dGTP diphosphatase